MLLKNSTGKYKRMIIHYYIIATVSPHPRRKLNDDIGKSYVTERGLVT